jgi:LacI family transcriptional regulator
MATIRDVARFAGVSIGSVSLALNNPSRVSANLRARVEEAAQVLGYAPNPAARRLRKKFGNLLGLIVADVTNPFFAEIVKAIEGIACTQGYSVLLCNSDEDVLREVHHIHLLRSQHVDGVILASVGQESRERAAALAGAPFPVVLVDRALDGLGLDVVILDNRAAGREATRHILSFGHTRIGMIAGPGSLVTGAGRLDGYREALLSHGLPFDPELVRDGAFQETRAYDMTLELLRMGNPPTAIVAANNQMTIGMMRAIADRGLSCPDDISVVCVDDFPWARASRPRLTVVAQPTRAMGETAFRLLWGRMTGAIAGPARVEVMAPELIIRESCAQPLRSCKHKRIS